MQLAVLILYYLQSNHSILVYIETNKKLLFVSSVAVSVRIFNLTLRDEMLLCHTQLITSARLIKYFLKLVLHLCTVESEDCQ